MYNVLGANQPWQWSSMAEIQPCMPSTWVMRPVENALQSGRRPSVRGPHRPAPLSRRPRAPKQSVAQVSLNDLSVRSNRHSLLRDDWAILRMKHHGNFPSLVHYVRMGTILAWMKIPFISFGFLESTQCHDALSESRCPALRQPLGLA